MCLPILWQVQNPTSVASYHFISCHITRVPMYIMIIYHTSQFLSLQPQFPSILARKDLKIHPILSQNSTKIHKHSTKNSSLNSTTPTQNSKNILKSATGGAFTGAFLGVQWERRPSTTPTSPSAAPRSAGARQFVGRPRESSEAPAKRWAGALGAGNDFDGSIRWVDDFP